MKFLHADKYQGFLQVDFNTTLPLNHYKCRISTNKILMATKRGILVTYHEGLSPILSHDPLLTCSCDTRDKLKPLYLRYPSAYGHQSW